MKSGKRTTSSVAHPGAGYRSGRASILELLTALTANLAVWAVCFAYFVRNANPAGALIAMTTAGTVVILTSIGILGSHLVLRAVSGKRRVRPGWRVLSYALPAILVVLLSVFLPQPERGANQQDPLSSPGGQYVLRMPIENGKWKLTIYGPHGGIEYIDPSGFPGWLNVYWCWDEENRAWLYDSDTGRVYYWEKAGNRWRKGCWGAGRKRECARDLQPPEFLYPRYVNGNPGT